VEAWGLDVESDIHVATKILLKVDMSTQSEHYLGS
jgi:hypothetical protein